MIGDPMKQPNEYVPNLESGERLPADISAEDSVRAWIDLMRTADKLMLARFAQEVGEENAESAYFAVSCSNRSYTSSHRSDEFGEYVFTEKLSAMI